MRNELKKAIMDWIFENSTEWQIVNACVNHFRAYIYDSNGNYLIGGEEVSEFISQAIDLIRAF